MAKRTARRSKRRTASRSKTKRKKTAHAKSARRASKRKAASRRKTAKRATAKRSPRKLTTAEAMHKALEMKQAAEQREHKEHPQPPTQQTWPMQMPPSVEPDPIPENLREQGDVANIIQNTSNHRAG